MKNVNTNVVLFDRLNISLLDNQKYDLLGICKDIPIELAKKTEAGIYCLQKLDVLLSINAIEKLDENKKPIREEGENASNTFFFDHGYRIKLRITETNSGQFMDLSSFEIDPKDNVSLCRNIYNKSFLLQYSNVSVASPPEGKDLCVLKVLIQSAEANETDAWIVQSIHPIRLLLKD